MNIHKKLLYSVCTLALSGFLLSPQKLQAAVNATIFAVSPVATQSSCGFTLQKMYGLPSKIKLVDLDKDGSFCTKGGRYVFFYKEMASDVNTVHIFTMYVRDNKSKLTLVGNVTYKDSIDKKTMQLVKDSFTFAPESEIKAEGNRLEKEQLFKDEIAMPTAMSVADFNRDGEFSTRNGNYVLTISPTTGWIGHLRVVTIFSLKNSTRDLLGWVCYKETRSGSTMMLQLNSFVSATAQDKKIYRITQPLGKPFLIGGGVLMLYLLRILNANVPLNIPAIDLL